MAPTHNLNGEMSEKGIRYYQTMRTNNVNSDVERRPNVTTAKTLQSVLLGEVPSAYVHLAVPTNTCFYRDNDRVSDGSLVMKNLRRTPESSYRPYACSSPSRLAREFGGPVSPHYDRDRFESSPVHRHSPNVGLYGQSPPHHIEADMFPTERESPVLESRYSPFHDCGSPFIGHRLSPHCQDSSPLGSVGSSHESSMPFSYQRHSMSPYSPHQRPAETPSPFSSQGSPYARPLDDVSSHSYLHASEASSDDSFDQPIDLSKKPEKNIAPAPRQCILDVIDSKGSLLRNLLTPGARACASTRRQTPETDCYKPEVPISGSTRVTLNKKMVFPITSRVSDWLVKIVQFSKSIPEFTKMSQNDRFTVLNSAWTRMLLFLMAENDSEFAVTPLPAGSQPEMSEKPTPDEPTMKSVEGIQNFIKKCKNLSMDQKEFALLRMAVLFNTGMYIITFLKLPIKYQNCNFNEVYIRGKIIFYLGQRER